ncbi:hypothetical protein [methane-oxidizing endosymbiont of Gigantopelta aegis]|uniref:hypothetical protein n=1 Tax=methane-oxidizing endosymbiont of Gigantopelta aegis TaxID=2794938 RepID=UPI0018DCD21A|nr:hypothetical protein [methane-oxidizing endosymbiont of Gigantopelta aegis]
MIKTTYVAILLLISSTVAARPLDDAIEKLESDWAKAYYQQTHEQQKASLSALIKQAQTLSQQYPEAVEPKIWHAVLLSTQAANLPAFEALTALDNAKTLLEQSIKQNPNALAGTAFTTLGTLYFMAPPWPISFGDNEKARQMLLKGLKINPNGIDSNYFYAKFLLSQGQDQDALNYLKKALAAPLRTTQQFADSQLKQEVIAVLNHSGKEKLAQLFSGQTQYKNSPITP